MRTTESLLRSEYTNRDTKALLQPLEELAQGDFWRRQWAASALFRSSDLLTHYRLPMRLSGTLGRGRQFSCAPAVALFAIESVLLCADVEPKQR